LRKITLNKQLGKELGKQLGKELNRWLGIQLGGRLWRLLLRGLKKRDLGKWFWMHPKILLRTPPECSLEGEGEWYKKKDVEESHVIIYAFLKKEMMKKWNFFLS
jgi:hypothetical protein